MRLLGAASALAVVASAFTALPAVASVRFAPTDRGRLAREPGDRVRVLLAGRVGHGDEIADLVRAKDGMKMTELRAVKIRSRPGQAFVAAETSLTPTAK